MKLLIAIKPVVDHHSQAFKSPLAIDENTPMMINPFDEVALDYAMKLKSQKVVDEIILASVGGAICRTMLEIALAFDADKAIWVHHEGDIDALGVANYLTHIAKREHIDAIMLGKQAIDSDMGVMAHLLAAKLNWALATAVSDCRFSDNHAMAQCEIDGGQATVQLDLPCVLAVDLRLAIPRIPSVSAIVAAKKKPIEQLDSAQIMINNPSRNITPQLSQRALRVKTRHRQTVMVKSATALLAELQQRQLL